MVYVDSALARRLELTQAATLVDYVETAARIYPELGTRYLPLGGGAYAIYAGPGSPISRVAGLGFDGAVTRDDLEKAESFFMGAGEKPQVDLCPLADGSLVYVLGARGYRVKWCLNVHFMELGGMPADELNSGADQKLGRGARHDLYRDSNGIVKVVSGDETDLNLWARTVSDGFDGLDRPAVVHPSIAFVTGQKPGVVRFLAYAGSEPAGGAALDMRDRLAIFCSSSTRVGFRGMGIHAALLRARLAAAAGAGCDLAMVMTAPGAPSQRNVERAGFRTAYTVIRMVR